MFVKLPNRDVYINIDLIMKMTIVRVHGADAVEIKFSDGSTSMYMMEVFHAIMEATGHKQAIPSE